MESRNTHMAGPKMPRMALLVSRARQSVAIVAGRRSYSDVAYFEA